jgi:hypothetical protein
MPKSEQLSELQSTKSELEHTAHRLREGLHKLVAERPPGWRAEFSRDQGELIEVAGRIGQLDKTIRSLVEAAAGPAKEDDGDV